MQYTRIWAAHTILLALSLGSSGCMDAVDQPSHADDSAVETHAVDNTHVVDDTHSDAATNSPADLPELPQEGRMVKVHFTGFALGGNLDNPISVTTDIINGAQVTLSGRFVSMNDEWLVLDYDNTEKWIVREHVLYVEFSR